MHSQPQFKYEVHRYQVWLAYHRAMMSDIPLSVLHPGFPQPKFEQQEHREKEHV